MWSGSKDRLATKYRQMKKRGKHFSWYFLINFLVEKCSSLSFQLVKWISPLLPNPGKKTFLQPCSLLCRLGLLKLFCTCPTIHQTHHFATPYPCWSNNTDKTIFFSFQLPKPFCISSQKFFGCWSRTGAKKFRCPEPEPEPEIWVTAQQPCFRLLQPTIRKMRLLKNFFCVF